MFTTLQAGADPAPSLEWRNELIAFKFLYCMLILSSTVSRKENNMPTSTTVKLPNEPIVVDTLTGSSAELLRTQSLGAEMIAILNAAPEPLFVIYDVSKAQLSLDDIILGAARTARGDEPLLRHPKIRQLLAVTSDPTLELVAEGMDSEIFGNIGIRVFKTLDDALAYARAAR
jgi:hypothetical protein